MSIEKEIRTLGMSWESQYGYVQAVRVDDTIYVSGQLSHDDQGNMIGGPPLDESGNIQDHSNMEIQMRQTYANAKKILAEFGASLDNVVEEVIYVTDMDKAFAVAGPVRKEGGVRLTESLFYTSAQFKSACCESKISLILAYEVKDELYE